jgi:hypothetical protein
LNPYLLKILAFAYISIACKMFDIVMLAVYVIASLIVLTAKTGEAN